MPKTFSPAEPVLVADRPGLRRRADGRHGDGQPLQGVPRRLLARTSRTPASRTASSGTRPIAAKYPWYDLTGSGIYGTSAGGQNAAGGVLFHPEFYKVAVAACGCHDNRMDKASWNEHMLLIHQGTAPTPRDPEAWERLSEDEQKAVYADYKAINETPGVTSGEQMEPPETATTVRVQDGKTLTTDGPFVEIKEAIGGYCFFEADDLDAAIELAVADPGGAHGRRDRGAPDRGVVAILEQVFREQWGRVLAALIGFLGDFDLAEEAAAGGVRDRRRALAARRDARRIPARGC